MVGKIATDFFESVAALPRRCLFYLRVCTTIVYPRSEFRMRTLNPYGEDDSDLVRRFAIREDGTARYPILEQDRSNVVDLAEGVAAVGRR
jgi:hypothetical protein